MLPLVRACRAAYCVPRFFISRIPPYFLVQRGEGLVAKLEPPPRLAGMVEAYHTPLRSINAHFALILALFPKIESAQKALMLSAWKKGLCFPSLINTERSFLCQKKTPKRTQQKLFVN